ncbi:DUF4386 domain-containing protein [Rugamonas sp. CCM 8940]|uniref:DUF4386 domain-containing protein n=1 Tax=Rugamonas sp. CCM 8940 TaxID=2765359 RepID=UPI0018F6EC1F|nr:DUF4386 domain-containing protein [Rugamonas sp. CCM 8940]MBJ7313205.1 DUF4386 domain-containing protein [Rugamonas sp. CCM 8940]
MQNTSDQTTQIYYARIAGFVYLLLIVMYMSGEFIISGIVGNGDFAAAARHAAASEHLYRFALTLQVLTPLCTTVLAYALYVALKPVNERLANLALLFRLGETFIGAIILIFSFEQLRIYTTYIGTGGGLAAGGTEQWQTLLTLARHSHFVGFNSSTLFFGCGSILFFSLFLKSAYLPKVQAVIGIAASVLVVLVSLTNFILPEHAALTQFGFAPMFVSEIVSGLYLLVRGIKVEAGAHGSSSTSTSTPAAAALPA